MSVKLNIIANFISSGWGVLISLIFVPVYISYLGIESYGLIGVFVLLQTCLGLFDMGMTPALSRAMAQHTGSASSAQLIRNLLRSFEWVVCAMSAAIALGIWLSSDWLALAWLKAEGLPRETVSGAISIMGVIIGLRLAENLYRGSLVGLQQQTVLSAVTIATTTLRSAGAALILILIAPTITAFFVWQSIASIVTVAAYFITLSRVLPSAPERARFSREALRSIFRFAGGMMVLSALALVVMEMDKILLSRLIPLEHFAYYVLAGTIAQTVYTLCGPIMVAVYPRMVGLVARDERDALREAYHLYAQTVTVLLGATAVTLIVFAERLLLLWTGDAALAGHVAPILSVLVLGTLMHGLGWIPYHLQLAHGWTELAIKMNVVIAGILVPAILWAVPRYEAIGAAWVWVAVNTGYLTFGIYFMHRRLLHTEKWRWYRDDLAIPLAGAALMALGCRLVVPHGLGRLGEFAVLGVSLWCVLIASAVAAPMVRRQTVIYLRWAARVFIRRVHLSDEKNASTSYIMQLLQKRAPKRRLRSTLEMLRRGG